MHNHTFTKDSQSPTMSILTPTVRPQGLSLLKKSLKRQSNQDFEWIIGSPFDPECGIWVQDRQIDTQFWPLNHIYNDLLRKARGELVISYQDYIEIPPDTLERVWQWYVESDKRSCLTVVGDIYESLDPDVKSWEDPRKNGREAQGMTRYACTWPDLEFNFCAIPRAAFVEIGGCDEALDMVGYDPVNINVCERLEMAGYSFFIDQSIEIKGLKHDQHPDDWDANFTLFNGEHKKARDGYLANGIRLWHI